MMLRGETQCGMYGNSIYYLYNFSINLNVAKNFKSLYFKCLGTRIVFDHFPSPDIFCGFKLSKYIRKIMKKVGFPGWLSW